MLNPFRASFWRSRSTSKDPPEENIGIYNWSLCCFESDKNDCWRSSPTFSINGVSHCSFNILTSVDDSANLSILVRKNDLNEEFKGLQASAVCIKIIIPNYYCEMVKVNRWYDNCCFFENVVSLRTMPMHSNRSKGRSICIECGITWLGFVDGEEESLPLSLRDMTDYLMNEQLSDVTLVIDGKEIPAHKVVLASQSKKFLEIFESAQPETGNRFVLDDVTIDSMKIVLKYLYSGVTTALDNINIVKEVLAIAKNYGIEKLTILCEHKLRHSVSIENVVSIIALSKEISVMSLYDFAMRFISDNEEKIVQRDDFKDLGLKDPEISISLIGLQKKK